MPSNFQPKATSSRRLPFEPGKIRKKPSAATQPTSELSITSAPPQAQIPAVVSQRMVRRMALFCGVPTLAGFSTFPLSYLVVSRDWFNLPVFVVLLTTLGLFGLGVLGLSYGVLSASWEEDQPGTRLGWSEFKLNFGRLTEAWRSRKASS